MSPRVECRMRGSPSEDQAMTTISLEEAQARLKELIEQKPGEEFVIEEGGKPVARLLVEKKPERPPRRPGTFRGTVLYMAPDFDAPLEEFKEYLE
jgi:antitoxin (DNA-binding transcriptional repressor) of toxin-antitoxin stability system